MRSIAVFCVLACLAGVPAVAQSAQTKQDQSVKQDVRDAGSSTKRAAQKTGRKVKGRTKKGIHKGAEKTEQEAGKVRRSTQP